MLHILSRLLQLGWKNLALHHCLGRDTSMSTTDIRSHHIPPARGALPIVGHSLAFLREPFAFLNSLPAQGDVVEVQLGPMRMAIVCNPDLISTVLRNERVFDKGGSLIDRGRDLVGNGLITCPYSDHRRQRRLVQPAFHHSRMPGYGQVISEQVGAVLDSWCDGQVLDVVPAMKEITGRTTAAALFTTALPAEQFASAAADVETFSAGIFRRMLLPPLASRVPTPANIRYDRANRRLRRTIAQIIGEYRARGTDRGGLLPILVGSRDTEFARQQLSDPECADQAMTIFFAGIETASIALSWALHSLVQDDRIRTQLYNEVDEVLSGRTATHDDLPALQLTKRIVTETLRMRSPVWLLSRVVATETQLGDYRLPAGKVVGCSPLMTQHDPELYPDPDRFDPDRWLDPSAARTALMIPFGAGARKCIGDTLAVVEMTLVLASIAARWHIESDPSGMPRAKFHAFNVPKNLKIKITAR
jgi:pentalenene oxygenase